MTTKLKFNTAEPQVYPDSWDGGRQRVLRFKGQCLVCRSRVYGHDDGDDDPRGLLGESHCVATIGPHTDKRLTREHVLCWGCYNDRYWHLLAHARAERVETMERKRQARRRR